MADVIYVEGRFPCGCGDNCACPPDCGCEHEETPNPMPKPPLPEWPDGWCAPHPHHQHNCHPHHMTHGHHDGDCWCGRADEDAAFASWLCKLRDSLNDMIAKGHYPCSDAIGQNYECLVKPTNMLMFLDQYFRRCHERDWLALKCAELATDNEMIGLGHEDRSVKGWLKKAKAHTRFEAGKQKPGRRPLRKIYKPKFPESGIYGSLRDALN